MVPVSISTLDLLKIKIISPIIYGYLWIPVQVYIEFDYDIIYVINKYIQIHAL